MRRDARRWRRSSGLIGAVLFFLLVGLAVPATAARPGEPDPLEDGIFARGMVGFGLLLDNEESILGTDDTVTFAWDLAIGGMLAPRFALHGTFFGWSVFDEDPEGRRFSRYYDDSVSAIQTAFGPGVTFYLGNSGVYVTSSVGLSLLWRDIDDFADDEELATGIGVEVLMGKEWWSDFVGFGLSIGYIAHIDAEVADNLQLAGGSLGLHFSLSFNE